MHTKRIIFSLLIPTIAYGFSKDQFAPETRKALENKYVRFNGMLKKENITQNDGLVKIFKELEGATFDDVWQDPAMRNAAEAFYEAVKNDTQYEQLIASLKTADESEKPKILYDYLKFVQFKAKDILIQDCVAMEFPQEKSEGPHDIAWMKVDNPEWAKLNVGKHFDEKCKKCLVGINLGMSFFVQEMTKISEKK